MASVDWEVLADGLDATSVARGCTAGETPPSGGGSYVYGFNSMIASDGAVGLIYQTDPNFYPLASGGSISGCIKRGPSSGISGYSGFLFLGHQGSAIKSVNDQAYLIGLEDSEPSRICLVKGTIINGIPVATDDEDSVLASSNASYSNDTWVHIRLDMIVEPSGDVVLQVFTNDLDANPAPTPVWVACPGLEEFIDDALGVNSGSLPFVSGYAGFGFSTEEISRRHWFDVLQIGRQ